MSDILKQIDTYELIEYWKHEAYKSELKFKNLIYERNGLIERFLEEKTSHETRIKELEGVVKDLYNSLRRLSLSGDGSHSSKRESFYDCLPTLQLEYSERENFAREIINKHKDLIESITKEGR